jgi:hypothetical protein
LLAHFGVVVVGNLEFRKSQILNEASIEIVSSGNERTENLQEMGGYCDRCRAPVCSQMPFLETLNM